MKMRTLAAGAFVVAAAAGLSAQSTPQKDEDRSITVTGCLQPASPAGGAVGTSGSASGTTADRTGGFLLVNAREGSAPGGGSAVSTVAPAGSGTNESAVRAGATQPSPTLTGAVDANGNPDGGAARTYVLRGDHPDLPRHVGHEVQISGRMPSQSAASTTTSQQGASATTGAAATTTSGARSGAAASASMQDLEVQTVRMIASACAAK